MVSHSGFKHPLALLDFPIDLFWEGLVSTFTVLGSIENNLENRLAIDNRASHEVLCEPIISRSESIPTIPIHWEMSLVVFQGT